MKQPILHKKFSENLAQLPEANGVAAIELVDQSGARVGIIENKPGQAGSLRVYLWLAQRFEAITPAAAEFGLSLYAEHTADARQYPGKHPNIDRLFSIRDAEHTVFVHPCSPSSE